MSFANHNNMTGLVDANDTNNATEVKIGICVTVKEQSMGEAIVESLKNNTTIISLQFDSSFLSNFNTFEIIKNSIPNFLKYISNGILAFSNKLITQI